MASAERITWEYQTIKVQQVIIVDKLNELGAEGWEVYATQFFSDPTLSCHYLKRPTKNYEKWIEAKKEFVWTKEEW